MTLCFIRQRFLIEGYRTPGEYRLGLEVLPFWTTNSGPWPTVSVHMGTVTLRLSYRWTRPWRD
jgi:hypothetical protein